MPRLAGLLKGLSIQVIWARDEYFKVRIDARKSFKTLTFDHLAKPALAAARR